MYKIYINKYKIYINILFNKCIYLYIYILISVNLIVGHNIIMALIGDDGYNYM